MIAFRNECYEMRWLRCILLVCSVLQCFLSKGLKITSSFRLSLGETVIYLPSQCSRLEWPRYTHRSWGRIVKEKLVHLEVVCQLNEWNSKQLIQFTWTEWLIWWTKFETHFLDSDQALLSCCNSIQFHAMHFVGGDTFDSACYSNQFNLKYWG